MDIIKNMHLSEQNSLKDKGKSTRSLGKMLDNIPLIFFKQVKVILATQMVKM